MEDNYKEATAVETDLILLKNAVDMFNEVGQGNGKQGV